MDRDVYAKLLANLEDLKDLITGMSGDISDLETAVTTNSGNITGLQTLIATKLTEIIITGTIPTEGACSEEVGALADIKGWQWLVETSANIWSDLNQVTYYNNTNSSIYLHLEGTAAGYRGKDYKLIVYKLNQPEPAGG